MLLAIGKTTIRRRIQFEAEGDLGEKIPTSFIVTVERPTKSVSKAFSVLFASFADVVAERQNDKPGEGGSVVEFTKKVDTAEQTLSDFVKDRISDWDDVFVSANEPMEFNSENLNALFDDREARRAVFEDYQELVTGRKKEAAENLKKLEPAGSSQNQQ